MEPEAPDQQPEIPTIQLIHPHYQPMREELAEALSVEATLEELGQVVTRTVKVQYYKPNRARR